MQTVTEAHHGVLRWLASFENLSGSVRTMKDVCDGVALSEALAEISPATTDNTRLKKNVGDNWLLKSLNLKLLVGNLSSFHEKVLGRHTDYSSVDITAIARDSDENEVFRLAQAVLGCAVQSDNKEDYVRRMMTMDKKTQTELMILIEGIMSKHGTEAPTSATSSKGSVGRPPSFSRKESKVSSSSQFHRGVSTTDVVASLEAEVSEKSSHLHVLTQERDNLRRLLDQMRFDFRSMESERENAVSEARERRKNMERDLLRMEEENNRLQQDRDGMVEQRADLQRKLIESEDRIYERQQQLATSNKKNEEYEKKLERFGAIVSENRSLKDDLDILKAKVQESEVMETQVVRFKKKLEEAGDLRKQVKAVEDENRILFERNLALEQSVQKASGFKNQVDTFRSRLSLMEKNSVDQNTCIREKDATIEKLKESVEVLNVEKQMLQNQSEKQRIHVLNLQEQLASKSTERPEANVDELLTTELQKKLSRLERENEMLRNNLAHEQQERIVTLENDLSEAEAMTSNLKAELGATQQKVRDLLEVVEAGRAKDMELEMANQKMADLQAEIDSLASRLKDYHNQAQKTPALEAQVERYRSQLAEMETETSELTVSNQQKTFEIERLTRSLEREQKASNEGANEITDLKKKVTDLEREKHEIEVKSAREVVVEDLFTPALKRKMTRLEEETEMLREEKGETQQRIALLETQLADMEQLKSKFRHEHLTSNQKVLELEKELDLARGRVKEMESGLARTVERARETATSLENQLDETKKRCATMEAEAETLQKGIKEGDAAKARCEELQVELGALGKRNADLQTSTQKIPALLVQVDMYRQQLGQLEEESSEATLANQQKDAEIERLRRTLETLQEELEFKTKSETVGQEREKEIERLRQTLVELERNKVPEVVPAKTTEDILTPTLKRKMSRLEEETTTLRVEKEEIQQRIALLETQLTDMEQLKSKFKHDFHGANQRALDLEKEVETLRVNLREAEAKRQEAVQYEEEAKANLFAKGDEAGRKISELETTMKALQARAAMADAAEARVEQLETTMEGLQRKSDDLQVANQKIPVLNTQVEMYRQQLRQLEEESSQMTLSAQQKDLEISRLVYSLERQRGDHTEKDEHVRKLCAQVDEATERIKKLEGDLAKAHNESARIASEVVPPENVFTPELKEKMARLEVENALLNEAKQGEESERVALLEKQVVDLSQMKEKFKQDYYTAHKQVLECENELEVLRAKEKELAQISQQCSQLEKENQIMQEQSRTVQHALEEKIEHLLKELDSLQAKENEFKVTKVKLAELKSERDELREKIAGAAAANAEQLRSTIRRAQVRVTTLQSSIWQLMTLVEKASLTHESLLVGIEEKTKQVERDKDHLRTILGMPAVTRPRTESESHDLSRGVDEVEVEAETTVVCEEVTVSSPIKAVEEPGKEEVEFVWRHQDNIEVAQPTLEEEQLLTLPAINTFTRYLNTYHDSCDDYFTFATRCARSFHKLTAKKAFLEKVMFHRFDEWLSEVFAAKTLKYKVPLKEIGRQFRQAVKRTK